MKALLILLDGMRPDAIADLPQVTRLCREASATMTAATVFPSVTLPCHMSLFHSVDPSRHGTTTNTYAPQVRPINGLAEVLHRAGKRNAFFYSWEELRDLARPDSLGFSCYCSGHAESYERADQHSVDFFLQYLPGHMPDFTFLYFGLPDYAGHTYGWMSPEYKEALAHSWERAELAINALPDDYTVFVTADHGGHDRIHGTAEPCDMTIPLFIKGPDFGPDKPLPDANIKDIAPTIAELLGVNPDPEWEGKSLLTR